MSFLHTGHAPIVWRSLCSARLDPPLLCYYTAVSRLFHLFGVGLHIELYFFQNYMSFDRYLPESPRWLMSQGRFAEVKAIMKTCAKINGKEFPEHLLPQLEVVV